MHLQDGAVLRIMLKDLSWEALGEEAREVKPSFLYDPRREIGAYRAILSANGVGAPIYYGSVVDRRRGRYWLLIEHVAGVPLWQVDAPTTWRHVVRWLATMHVQFAAHPERLTWAAPLLTYDADFYRLWPSRAQRFVRPSDPQAARALDRLVVRYDRVVERLVTLPVTVIHGELFPSNILIARDGGRLRVAPIDWEMAAVGPGLIDLAAVTAGRWAEADKTAMALEYRAELARQGGPVPSPKAFLAALDWCRLHLAMQWLGWSDSWSPPPEHAQDWLGEVLGLAEKLGV